MSIYVFSYTVSISIRYVCKLWHIPTVSPNGLLDLLSFFLLVMWKLYLKYTCTHNLVFTFKLIYCMFHKVLRSNNLRMRLSSVFHVFTLTSGVFPYLQAVDEFSMILVAVSNGYTFFKRGLCDNWSDLNDTMYTSFGLFNITTVTLLLSHL